MVEKALAIEREVRVEAAPETVFEFFVDPARIVRWMGRAAELDPRPGGLFRVEYGDGTVARGTFLEVDRPRRVVFTWGWENPSDPVQPGQSTVEVSLQPDGTATLVSLRHDGLDEESRRTHEEGWDYFLAELIKATGGRE